MAKVTITCTDNKDGTVLFFLESDPGFDNTEGAKTTPAQNMAAFMANAMMERAKEDRAAGNN